MANYLQLKQQFNDDIGQLHGTWGGCALIPGVDVFLSFKDFLQRKRPQKQ